MCGEYRVKMLLQKIEKGSPPRVRGIPSPSIVMVKVSRITPACAGNTTPSQTTSSLWRDHPRVCGEYKYTKNGNGFFSGSPPRVRGILFLFNDIDVIRGITPACAGNTQPYR